MNPEQILNVVKTNSVAAVAFTIVWINSSKQDTRIDRLEQKLYECYLAERYEGQKTAINQGKFDYKTFDLTQVFGILPKEPEEPKIQKEDEEKDIESC